MYDRDLEQRLHGRHSNWLTQENINATHYKENLGVSKGWNDGLRWFFQKPFVADHCLVLNNDTVIPPWFYSSLLSYDAPFVTGVSVGSMNDILAPAGQKNWLHVQISAAS